MYLASFNTRAATASTAAGTAAGTGVMGTGLVWAHVVVAVFSLLALALTVGKLVPRRPREGWAGPPRSASHARRAAVVSLIPQGQRPDHLASHRAR